MINLDRAQNPTLPTFWSRDNHEEASLYIYVFKQDLVSFRDSSKCIVVRYSGPKCPLYPISIVFLKMKG